MTQWYYSDSQRNRHGPVAARDLAELHHAGQLSPGTLVWREGLPQWRPWRDLMAEALEAAGGGTAPAVEAAAPASGVDAEAMAGPHATAPTGAGAVATAAPPSHGVNPYAAAEPASPYTPPQAALHNATDYVAGGEVVYAGFWKRYAALCIDSIAVGIVYYLILIVAMAVVFGTGGMAGTGPDALGARLASMMVVVYVLYPVISGLYYVGLESSSLQATLGKMAVGIKVTDNEGRRLGRTNALGRWVSHLLCYVTLYIGYLVAAFTDRKRGLHDMAASTLVVDKWAYTSHPERQRGSLGAVTIIVIALSVLAVLAYVAIVLAIAVPAYQSYVQRAGG